MGGVWLGRFWRRWWVKLEGVGKEVFGGLGVGGKEICGWRVCWWSMEGVDMGRL